MPTLQLTVDEVLATTRAVRKRLDFERPVALAVIEDCISLAQQSPCGSLAHMWHFVLVDDPNKRRALAELYRRAWEHYVEQPWSIANLHRNDTEMAATAERATDSAAYLVEHLHRAPWLLVPVLAGRHEGADAAVTAAVYGSILPAVWSFMLAARERGLGTCWTTGHLMYEREAADILGIPYDDYTQVALVPVAYTLGTAFKPGARKAMAAYVHRNAW